jgi:hypothetical protein
MIRLVLLASILVTAVVFAMLNAAGNLTIAAFALVVGALWLLQEFNGQVTLNSVYFLIFVGLAALGGLANAPLPLLLVGLCADLVAWDLSRFRVRIRDEEAGDEKSRLEMAHLQKLALVVGGGFVIALLPALLTISVNFVVLVVIMLVALVALRRALLSLRSEGRG